MISYSWKLTDINRVIYDKKIFYSVKSIVEVAIVYDLKNI